MNEITNEYDALVMALALAVSAPVGVGDKAKDLGDYAEKLAARCGAETVERAKAEAIVKAAEIRGDEPTSI